MRKMDCALDTVFLNTAPGGITGPFSMAAWVTLPNPRPTNSSRTILWKNAAYEWRFNTVNNRTGFYYNVPSTFHYSYQELILKTLALSFSMIQIYCMMQFSLTGSNRFTTTTRNFAPDRFNNDWTHLACVYNLTNICIFINGTLQSCSAAIARLSFPYNTVTTLAGNTNINGTAGLWGCMDELKLYDHALSSSQLIALANPSAANLPPKVLIGTF